MLGTLGLSVGIGKLLQSKYSAHFISQQISKLIDKKVVDLIKFERVGIQFIPPGITVSGVGIDNFKDSFGVFEQTKVKSNIRLDRIELQFDLLKLLKDKIAFSNAIISGGIIELKVKQVGSNEEVEVLLDQISSWRRIISTRIQNVILKEIEININENSFYSKYVSLSSDLESLYLSLNLYSVKTPDFKRKGIVYKGFNIDEVKINAEMSDHRMSIENLHFVLDEGHIFAQGVVEGNPADIKGLKYNGNISIKSLAQETVRKILPKINMNGLIHSRFKFKGKGRNFSGEGGVHFKNFRTSSLDIPNGTVGFKKVGQDIIVTFASMLAMPMAA